MMASLKFSKHISVLFCLLLSFSIRRVATNNEILLGYVFLIVWFTLIIELSTTLNNKTDGVRFQIVNFSILEILLVDCYEMYV